jgi:hypothetical protein
LEIQFQINWIQITEKYTKYISLWVTLYEKVSKPILRAVHKAILTGIMAIHNNWPNCNFLYKYTKTVVSLGGRGTKIHIKNVTVLTQLAEDNFNFCHYFTC